MRLKFHLLATVFAVTAPCIASAQMFNMPDGYVGVAGGWNMLYNSKIENGVNLKSEFDHGWAALGTVGAKFDMGLRGELEIGYRTNDVDQILGTTGGTGEANTWTIMGNVLYDFMNTTPFTPYIGLGAGAARVEYDGVAPIGAGVVISDEEWAPAAQAIAGVSYKIMDNFSVFANYQYLRAFNLDLRASNGTKADIDYDASTILVGLKYTFGAPKQVAQAEPAPEPAPTPTEPAPSTPNSYLVFFDFDRANVTEEARQILRSAAENARGANATRIEVTGHADRSGSDDYNVNLSRRRAENVKNELVRLGMPASEITINAKGESDPLVPTEDGVREPQNRRVEIIYGQ